MKIILSLLILLGYASASFTVIDKNRSRSASLKSSGRDAQVLHDLPHVRKRMAMNRRNRSREQAARMSRILHGISKKTKGYQLTDGEFRLLKRVLGKVGNYKKFENTHKQDVRHVRMSGNTPPFDTVTSNVSSKTKESSKVIKQRLGRMKNYFTRKPLLYLKAQSDTAKNYLRKRRVNRVFVTIVAILLVAVSMFGLSYLIMCLIFSQHSEQHEPLLEQPILANPTHVTRQGFNQV